MTADFLKSVKQKSGEQDDTNSLIGSIKEVVSVQKPKEQDLIKDLELSAKNLMKTVTTTDNNLLTQERENLDFLYNSYKKVVGKTQQNLEEIKQILVQEYQKAKKMEDI